MAFGLDNVTGFFRAAAPAAAATPATAPQKSEAQQLFDYKKEALNEARKSAHRRVVQMESELDRPLTQQELRQNGMPTLADYYTACGAVGEKHNLSAEQWRPEVFADLSGQQLRGFKISEPQQQKIYGLEEENPAPPKDRNFYDQDSDQAINDFYTNIDFNGANLKDCFVEPATSFNDEIARAATLEHMTFNNMREGDKFLFGSGEYSDIKLTNINGGELEFNGTKVKGLDMEGAKVAAITLNNNTSINNLNAKDARIVTISLAPGAKAGISHANFTGATIDMASNMQGITLQDVKFKGSNLNDVNLKGATLTNVKFKECNASKLNLEGATLSHVKFKGTDLKGANFKGATFNDVSINGKAITNVADLEKALGTKVEGVRITASKAFILQAQVDAVAETAKGWQSEVNGKPNTAVAQTDIGTGKGHYEAMNSSLAAPQAPAKTDVAMAQQGATPLGPQKTTTEIHEPNAAELSNTPNPGLAIAMMKKVQPERNQQQLPPRGGRST